MEKVIVTRLKEKNNICQECKKNISNLVEKQKFCSQKCAQEYHYKMNFGIKFNSLSKEERQINCGICNTLFIRTTKSNKYCSNLCKKEARDKINIANQELGKFIVYKRDKFTCIYCGRNSIVDKIKLHVEHIVPFSLCFHNRIENLVTACQDCNLEKSDSLLDIETKNKILLVVEKRNLESNISPTQVIKMGTGYDNYNTTKT